MNLIDHKYHIINNNNNFLNVNYKNNDIFDICNKIKINYNDEYKKLLLEMSPQNKKYFKFILEPKECTVNDFILLIEQLNTQSNTWYDYKISNWLLYAISNFARNNKEIFDTLIGDYDYVNDLENLLNDQNEKLNYLRVVQNQNSRLIDLQDRIINILLIEPNKRNKLSIGEIIDDYNDEINSRSSENNNGFEQTSIGIENLKSQLNRKIFINNWLTKDYNNRVKECDELRNKIDKDLEGNKKLQNKIKELENDNKKLKDINCEFNNRFQNLSEENEELNKKIKKFDKTNKMFDDKLEFNRKVFIDQIKIEREKSNKYISNKDQEIKDILIDYPSLIQRNQDNLKMLNKMTNKYDFILKKYLNLYEKYYCDREDELNKMIDSYYIYKEKSKIRRYNKNSKIKKINDENNFREEFGYKYVFFVNKSVDRKDKKMYEQITNDLNELIKIKKNLKIESKLYKFIPNEKQMIKIISKMKKEKRRNKKFKSKEQYENEKKNDNSNNNSDNNDNNNNA